MLSDDVARRLLELRESRKLTRKDVSQRLANLGLRKITPAALNNIETGRRDESGRRRREVTVDELIDLSIVLNVPPVLLIAPVGSADRVEVLPGRADDAWTTYRWLIGELPTEMLSEDRDPAVIYSRSDESGRAISAYRRHHNAIYNYLVQRGTDPDMARKQLPIAAGARIEMHQTGQWLPPLPEDVRAEITTALNAWGYVDRGDGSIEPIPTPGGQP